MSRTSPRLSTVCISKKNIDLYITGSNAYMLSSEIATLLAGRYVQIEMLPLSFKEYWMGAGKPAERGILYTEYLVTQLHQKHPK